MEGELQLNICSLSLHTGQMATVQVARLGRGNTDVGFGVVQPFFCFSTKKKQVLLKPQMSRMWYRSSHLTNGKGKKIRIVFRLSCHFPIFNICCNYLKDGKRKTLLMTVNVELNNKIKPGYYFQTYEKTRFKLSRYTTTQTSI